MGLRYEMPYEIHKSCRCCRNPSPNFINLRNKSKIEGAEEKSYDELLQEVTSGFVTRGENTKMPQMICRKCVKRLKTAYTFLIQVQSTYDYYCGLLQAVDDQQNFKQLDEILIELPETKYNGEEDIPSVIKHERCNSPEGTKVMKDLSETSLCLEDDDDYVNEEYLAESSLFEKIELQEGRGPDDDMACSDTDEVYEVESLDDTETNAINQPIACRCDICHKVFRDERSLAIHKRFTHMPEEEKMPCPLCSYKASRSSALKVHMGLIHGPDIVEQHFKPHTIPQKNFPCQLCDRGYQRREDLRKHIRKKHKPSLIDKPKRKEKIPKEKEELRFLCSFCGQSYTSKKALDGHQLTHTGERPHECDVCHKSFKRVKDMKAHRVIHSDEKPFQCSQCTKSFKRSDKLKMHMRVHSELRPYKCKECDKSFKYPCVLRTHMYMHTGQTPFSCATCGESFSLRTSLNNHCLRNGHTKWS